MSIRFNLDGLLRGSYESRMRGYQTAVNTGIFSINDCRRLESMDLIPEEEGGDIHMVQGAMIPLSMVGAAYIKKESSSSIQSNVNAPSSNSATSADSGMMASSADSRIPAIDETNNITGIKSARKEENREG